jgi:hypothetical protein
MLAAENGHALAVKALLEGGADIGQVDKVRKRVDDGRVMGRCCCCCCFESGLHGSSRKSFLFVEV